MARHARLLYPGGTFHIISRCLNREHLISDETDRQRYLAFIETALKRSDATVLAWALMSNHVHLVVRAGDDPLERLLKPLNTGYAGWKNRRAGRLGPVFAGRYKSVLVDDEAYLLELVRYVHNNPVRAGVVSSASESDWTSHRAYLGFAPAPAWLSLGEVFARFSGGAASARAEFDGFVNEGRAEKRRPELAGDAVESARRGATAVVGDAWRLSCPVVGDEEFAAKVFDDLRRLDTTVESPAAPRSRRPELEELLAHACATLGLERWEFDQQPKRPRPRTARMVVTWLWIRRYDGKQADVARLLKAPSSRVSSWYGEAVKRLPELEPLMDSVEGSLPEAAPTVPWKTARKVHVRLTVEDEGLDES